MIWDSGRYGLFEGMDLDCCWAPEGPALSPLGVRALRAWQDVEGLMWHSSHVTPAYPSFSPRQGASSLPLSPGSPWHLQAAMHFWTVPLGSVLGLTGLSFAEVLGGILLGQRDREV